jgi:cysteinyl-tRNA synthetase
MAAIFRLVRLANYLMGQGRLHRDDAAATRSAFRDVDRLFGILSDGERDEIPAEVEQLIHERDEARRRKDFDAADLIRDTLSAQGYALEDLPGGTRVKRRL